MSKRVIINARVVTPKGITALSNVWIQDGQIERIDRETIASTNEEYEIIDAGGHLLIPGMIDVHIHGANGFDMMDGTEESILEVSRTCALTGCTSFLVTSVTSSIEDLMSMIHNVKQVIGREPGAINFNVLFELGYAVGLAHPVLPIRDVSYARDAKELEELGFLDTLGYESFQNADEVVDRVLAVHDRPVPTRTSELLPDPIYVVMPLIQTEGVQRVRAFLNRSAFRYRVFDPGETPRLSLSDARRQIAGSKGWFCRCSLRIGMEHGSITRVVHSSRGSPWRPRNTF